MADTTVTPNDNTTPEPTAESPAKSHFSKAVEEAKAGAQALGKDAQGRAEDYREKMNQKKDVLTAEAKIKSEEAKDKAYGYANESKAKASEAMVGLGKLVEEKSALIDEKVGAKYGDYARTAARSINDVGARLDEKTLEELGEDAKEFVREKPALAVGIAAAAGYMLARLFRGK